MKIWHPFTQEKTAGESLKIIKGSEVYLFDNQGKKYLDMISSWWVNILGHANKEIANAIYEQAQLLEHVIFAKFTHEPAEKLCESLYKLLPQELEYFFFSDDGSTAVEVALKMAYQYFYNSGNKKRNIYINLAGGYHGDTLGAMSAAGVQSDYHSTFSEFFFQTFSIDFPENKENEAIAIEKLQKFLYENNENVCALIIEPLIQGAAGMRIYSAEFLDKVVQEVRKYEILVIFDEIFTGFYRTGTMFAMDQASEKPDIVCLAKGITGGFLPLALTVTTNKIYETFFSDDWKKAFIHGHSYTANPLACAAACKTIEILQQKKTIENIKQISKVHNEMLLKLNNVYNKKRSLGTIAAFDVENPKIAKKIEAYLLKNGVIVRPLGTTIYLLPPYCISKEELMYVYKMVSNFKNM
ncbi:MAG: adenosylmethionine--8-amino-7-oxononanoate transaminase [Holosporales bacterium]|jgi:adenosylmethionine-8-amino-7-oxononanoate aminotransferase|nr:adenosylmethionine--8-amino-7-oxononanoate transaminase [Holosporales bacterium]